MPVLLRVAMDTSVTGDFVTHADRLSIRLGIGLAPIQYLPETWPSSWNSRQQELEFYPPRYVDAS